MKIMLTAGLAVTLLTGCALSGYRSGAPFTPERLAKISMETGSPYTNYENVWYATLSVMERNYSVGSVNKERGQIESHPEFYHAGHSYMKDLVYATIRYDDGMFVPEIKQVTFIDTSAEDAFSNRPTKRQWRQLIESRQRAFEMEDDVRRILLPEAYRQEPAAEPKPVPTPDNVKPIAGSNT